MIGSFAAMAASLAALPHLLAPVPAPKDTPVAWLAHGEQHEDLVELIVSPAGQAIGCKVMSSGLRGLDAKVCDQIEAAKFAPALDGAGRPAYGRLTMRFDWPDYDGPARPPIADIDLTVERLPPGSPVHPRTELALTVEAQGHVEACDVIGTSGVAALDTAACKAGPASVPIRPLTTQADGPVRYVQSLVVGFAARPALILKKDPHYADLGPAGPYYPERALRMFTAGYADLACTATAEGELTNCAIETETPTGFAFGLAALRMAKTKWMTVAPGAPGPVLVRVDFPHVR